MAGHSTADEDVESALGSDDPALRRAALGAAARRNMLDVDRLTSYFADPDPSVANRAVELAARQAGSRSDAVLDAEQRTTLADRVAVLLDGNNAEIAAFALGELEVTTPTIVNGLERNARGHDDPLCRESAVAALGALGAGLDAVLHAMGDIAAVRRRAVIALANFDDDRADAALTGALDDRDWQVRQIAEDLVGIELEADRMEADRVNAPGEGADREQQPRPGDEPGQA